MQAADFFFPPALQNLSVETQDAGSPHGKAPPDINQVELEQVHSDGFLEITEVSNHCALRVDAAWTRLPKLLLKIKHADCLPILAAHPNGIIVAIHAGRRSTQAGIAHTLFSELKRVDPNLDQAWDIRLGPCICQKCYQIDRRTDEHYDLRAENIQQLEEVLDLNACQVRSDQRCTLENPQLHSYRESGPGVPMNWSGVIRQS